MQCLFKDRNFRGQKFSRVEIFADIYFREFEKFAKFNARKMQPRAIRENKFSLKLIFLLILKVLNSKLFLNREIKWPWKTQAGHSRNLMSAKISVLNGTHFLFYRQLHFSSEPGVANEFWEKKAESC